jgi:hypothetical protein
LAFGFFDFSTPRLISRVRNQSSKPGRYSQVVGDGSPWAVPGIRKVIGLEWADIDGVSAAWISGGLTSVESLDIVEMFGLACILLCPNVRK